MTVVSNSTIADNASGGIAGSVMAVSNSTIADNSGVGLEDQQGTLTVSDSTIAYNTRGGFLNNFGTVSVSNSIVAGNSNGSITYGSFASSSAYNLIGTGGSGGLVNGVNGNQVGVTDPGLGPLAGNGGPTQTIALLPGTAAINAGSNALAVDAQGHPLTTDQRGTGFPRIVDGTVDIGAFEAHVPFSSVSALPSAGRASASPSPSPARTAPTASPSGITTFDIYSSTNRGPWTFWTSVPATNPSATFTGQSNTIYAFYSIAHDLAGYTEVKTPTIEASTYLPDLTPPVTADDGTIGTKPAR